MKIPSRLTYPLLLCGRNSMVEYNFAKVDVAGSIPAARSLKEGLCVNIIH